jgi:hypothetical protein
MGRIAAVGSAAERTSLLARNSADGPEQINWHDETDALGDDMQPQRSLGGRNTARPPAVAKSTVVLEETITSNGGPLIRFDLNPSLFQALAKIVGEELALISDLGRKVEPRLAATLRETRQVPLSGTHAIAFSSTLSSTSRS